MGNKKIIMEETLQTKVASKLYSMKEVAEILNIEGIGTTNLYWYFKQLNLIGNYNYPNSLLMHKGYFKVGYGTKNTHSQKSYPKTLVTEVGLKWLTENIFNQIRELEKERENS